jgi:hypothetical protein
MPHTVRACLLKTLYGALFTVVLTGCRSGEEPTVAEPEKAPATTTTAAVVENEDSEEVEIAPTTYELNAESLLSSALPDEQLEQGWVRIFDGQSLAGWFMVGNANWQVKDQTIKVTRGERSYLCTSFMLADYELKIDFRSDAKTNSGIFLRTEAQPEDVAVDCLELNIAPPDNPFPTGSFVQRQRVAPEDLGNFDPTVWHTYHIRLIGEQVEVFLDDQQILEMKDSTSSRRGYISLQHNAGRVEFRNIMLRPVAAEPLKLAADWEEDWSRSEKEDGVFHVELADEGLKLSGGLGQLQSKRDFGDFVLQAKYSLARPEVNSGVFFRCVRDAMLDGYECQVNHAVLDEDPLRPADAGAGAIFRRQPARIVVGDGTQPTYLTLLASGQQMVTWVNGVQVVDFVDSRAPDDNPRKGSRTAPGPIALQGHDPTTEVTFHRIQVSESR